MEPLLIVIIVVLAVACIFLWSRFNDVKALPKPDDSKVKALEEQTQSLRKELDTARADAEKKHKQLQEEAQKHLKKLDEVREENQRKQQQDNKKQKRDERSEKSQYTTQLAERDAEIKRLQEETTKLRKGLDGFTFQLKTETESLQKQIDEKDRELQKYMALADKPATQNHQNAAPNSAEKGAEKTADVAPKSEKSEKSEKSDKPERAERSDRRDDRRDEKREERESAQLRAKLDEMRNQIEQLKAELKKKQEKKTEIPSVAIDLKTLAPEVVQEMARLYRRGEDFERLYHVGQGQVALLQDRLQELRRRYLSVCRELAVASGANSEISENNAREQVESVLASIDAREALAQANQEQAETHSEHNSDQPAAPTATETATGDAV